MPAGDTLKVNDTYPPIVFGLQDSNGPVDLTNATTIAVFLKGLVASLISGTGVSLQAAITATTSASSNPTVLTSVSSFTGIFSPGATTLGTPLIGPGIPSPVYNATTGLWVPTTVAAFDAVAQTITMTRAATVTATGVAIQVNTGLVKYLPAFTQTDTYTGEVQITWPGGIQTFPNSQQADFVIEVDPTVGELT